MISIFSALAFFILLIVSSMAFFVAQRYKIPYTVLLVLIGLILVPFVQLPFIEPALGFISNLALTPELLFYIFLPLLIFESAFKMNMRKMIESAWSILSLAVIGLLISTLVIATSLYYVLPLLGLPIPFILALLFGAIISSTDPVAVLALFKEYGAPHRLTLIFEGESLFNDGTAVALFLVILTVAVEGFHGAGTILNGIGIFLMMVLLGIGFGMFMAALVSRGLRYTRSNEFVTITVLIVSAHLVFILSELINAHTVIAGLHIHISAIIATTVSSLFLGNFARHSLSPSSDKYLEKSIEHLAFIANSLVFLLAGILFATVDIDLGTLWVPILVSVLIVATARIISIYAVTTPLNRLKIEAPIPASWQSLLSWGSLRGALAIIVVLLIPNDLTLAGWTYSFTPKELILAFTIGCILATLFIKGLTIGPLIKRLKLDQPTTFQEAYTTGLGLYYLQSELARITDLHQRGFVPDDQFTKFSKKVRAKITQTRAMQAALTEEYGERLYEQVLRFIAIEIEISYLKDLYSNGEVSEQVYRKIKGKLNLQKEQIEHGKYDELDPSAHIDRKDVFDRLVYFVQSAFTNQAKDTAPEEKYQYYRAQSIISRKVLKTLEHIQTEFDKPPFSKAAHKKLTRVYELFHEQAEIKAEAILAKYSEQLADFSTDLTRKTLRFSGNKTLAYMTSRGIASESVSEEIRRQFQV